MRMSFGLLMTHPLSSVSVSSSPPGGTLMKKHQTVYIQRQVVLQFPAKWWAGYIFAASSLTPLLTSRDSPSSSSSMRVGPHVTRWSFCWNLFHKHINILCWANEAAWPTTHEFKASKFLVWISKTVGIVARDSDGLVSCMGSSWGDWHRETIEIVGTDISRLDNAAPDKTVVSLSSSWAYRLLLILQIKQWCLRLQHGWIEHADR